MADNARCKGLTELFLAGRDIHTETTAILFGCSMEEAKAEERRYPTKRAGFGCVYGIGKEGLYEQFIEFGLSGWDLESTGEFLANYLALYPEIITYRHEQVAFALKHGYVRDMFGRIRFLPGLKCPIESIRSAAERECGNFRIQSGAQGIIKLATGRLDKAIPDTFVDVDWLMQVHDQLDWEVYADLVAQFAQFIGPIMEGVVTLAVPVLVDCKSGPRWGSMGKVKREDPPVLLQAVS